MSVGHSISVREQTVKEPKTLLKLKVPKRYKVFLLNDDYTPMDFVVEVLKRFFYLNDEVAVSVMLQVHTQGRGLCGLFSKDVAETKVVQVNEYSRSHEHPLLCGMEPE